MTGTTTGQTALTTATDSDDVELYGTSGLVTALQAIANKFESAGGHAHNASGGGAPIGAGGIASGVTLTSPHFTSAVVDSGGIVSNRYKATGAAVVAGDVVVGAGWGNTATLTIGTGSTDQRGQLSILCQGSSIAANPTIVFTFHDGTWTTAPFVVTTTQDSALSTLSCSISVTATALTITFCGTPVSGRAYAFNYIVMG